MEKISEKIAVLGCRGLSLKLCVIVYFGGRFYVSKVQMVSVLGIGIGDYWRVEYSRTAIGLKKSGKQTP